MSTTPSPTEFIKTATHTAYHYGFTPAHSLLSDKQCKRGKRMSVKRVSAADRKIDAEHGLLTSGICTYYEGRLYALGTPLLFFSVDSVPRTGEAALSLHRRGKEHC